jgi:integrase
VLDVASIRRSGKGWRAELYVKGQRDSKVFDTKAQASAWAIQREGELSGKRLPSKTFADALKKYGEEVAPSHKGYDWEMLRVNAMAKLPMARKQLSDITPGDITEWKTGRLKSVAPGTVLREMKLMRSVFEAARKDFHWLLVNPMAEVSKPIEPPSRKRRITDDEIDRLRLAFGLGTHLAADTDTQRAGLAFLLALETAMRAGEMLGLRWRDVHLDDRYVDLPRTKNGDERAVPLTTQAVDIIKTLPVGQGDDLVFGLAEKSRDALFRKIRGKAAIADLHFHDSRAEAIWRLSKKLDVLQLARVIGHRDLRSLMIYYNETAADLAKRLD